MRATGIVRRVDDLGRIVIPKEVRNKLGIKEGTPMELFIDRGCVIFKHYPAEEFLKNALDNLKNAVNTYVYEDDYDQDIKARLIEYTNRIDQALGEREDKWLNLDM